MRNDLNKKWVGDTFSFSVLVFLTGLEAGFLLAIYVLNS